MIILVDSRQKKGHHSRKHTDMQTAGCELLMCKLPYGDYMRGDTLPDELLTDIRALHAEYMAGREPKAKLRKSVSDRLLELHPLSVDTKQDLQEVYGNVIGDHIRFRQELETAHTGEDSRLIVLIEQGEIRTLQNVHTWKNPRAIRWGMLRKRGINAGRPPASSSQLQKAMETMSVKYGVKWEFCSPKDSGKRIIELLGG